MLSSLLTLRQWTCLVAPADVGSVTRRNGVSYSGHVTKDSDPAQLASRLALPPALRAAGYDAPLTMQPPTDPELLQLLELIERGIHDPSEMPFLTSRFRYALAAAGA